jgi:hypothetical protein
MNSLILIDALFKNSKPPALKLLQGTQLSELLSLPGIDSDPQLHNFLYECMPAWTSALNESRVGNPKFLEFCAAYGSTHYVPKITPQIRAKLVQDLGTANEVLTVMAECLISAAHGEANMSLLEEIHGNVREISERLIELGPKIEDPHLKSLIAATRDLCAIGIKAEAAFKGGRAIDEQALKLGIGRARALLEGQPAVSPPREKRAPPRRCAVIQDETDIAESVFGAELVCLKRDARLLD